MAPRDSVECSTLKTGCGRVHWLGGGREGECTPWSVLFILGSVLGVQSERTARTWALELPSDLLLIADILLAFPVGLKAVRGNSDRFLPATLTNDLCQLLAWTLMSIARSLSNEIRTKGAFMTTPLYE